MSRNTRCLLRLAAVLIGLGALPSGLVGQEATAFLVLARPMEQTTDPDFQRLIEGYIRFELQRQKLLVLPEADSPEAEPSLPDSETSAKELQKTVLRHGNKAKADFVLLCSYGRLRPEIQLHLDCYELAADGLVSTQTARNTRGLELDRTIADLVAKILLAIGPRLVYLTSAPEATALAAEQQADAQAVRPRQEPPPPPSFPPVEPVVNPLEVSLRLSPLFMVGDAANYFRLGFFPSLSGSYRLYTRAGHLGLGVCLGALLFHAQSPSTDAQGYLIPLAATISFLRPFPDSRLTFQLRLASGPALFVLDPVSAAAQIKILAYLGTGVGAELSLSAAWGLRLEMDYSIFFEKRQPIMGYAPALYWFYRL